MSLIFQKLGILISLIKKNVHVCVTDEKMSKFLIYELDNHRWVEQQNTSVQCIRQLIDEYTQRLHK